MKSPGHEMAGAMKQQPALQACHMRQAGELDAFYMRPWSTVIRVPTNAGNVYFKSVAPALKHEAAITAALNEWQPSLTLPVLAVDAERGWLLMPDGGTRLREIIRESREYRHWEDVLRLYAGLQIDMASRANDMLALNVPDRRLAVLPALFAALLEDTMMLHIDREKGLTADEHRRLLAMKPQLGEMCEQLAGFGIPETLNHGDLTDGNVFMVDGRPRFFDWGDCAVSHPFYALRTAFVSLYFSLGLDVEVGGPEFDHLRDVYLDAWKQFAPREQLVKAFRLSQQLAALSGALGWHRVVSTLNEAEREEYAEPVPALLREFLTLTS
jgi:hypothetical protein